MLITIIHIHVKPESIDAFRRATIDNARQSVQEPGVARFDFLQNPDDPSRFVLIEAYRTSDAPAAHRATSHYQIWRDAVEPMMAEPRARQPYRNIFPEDAGW